MELQTGLACVLRAETEFAPQVQETATPSPSGAAGSTNRETLLISAFESANSHNIQSVV